MQRLFFASLALLGASQMSLAQNSLEEPILFDQKANATVQIKSTPKSLPAVSTPSNETKQNAQANVVVNAGAGLAYQLSNDKISNKDNKTNGEQFRVATWSLGRF
ncbi:MAG: hypothetical protein RLZZ502_1853 [Pseudomonadota bacterium]|jgi:hypothetical protein